MKPWPKPPFKLYHIFVAWLQLFLPHFSDPVLLTLLRIEELEAPDLERRLNTSKGYLNY